LGAIPGDPAALRRATDELEANADLNESIVGDVDRARSSGSPAGRRPVRRRGRVGSRSSMGARAILGSVASRAAAQRQARADAEDAHRAMGSAVEAALAADERGGAIGALMKTSVHKDTLRLAEALRSRRSRPTRA
jgi:hypothetical protein